MLYRWTAMVSMALWLLAACTPTSPSLDALNMTEQSTHSTVTEQTPDLSLYYGDRPPAATLIVGDQEQAAGVGTSTWTVEKRREEKTVMHGDAFGLVTPAEPLIVTSPFTATLLLPINVAPSTLWYRIQRASENLHWRTTGQESITWQVAIEQPDTSLALERRQGISFSLEPGQYLLEVYAEWTDLGSVDYGFFLEVQEISDDL